MNIKSIFRLFCGLLLVTAAAGALTLYVDTSRSALGSQTAQISAGAYSVGVDYTGLIVKQYVQEGDTVATGQRLFEIRSSTLTERLQDKDIDSKQLIYALTSEGNILLQATKPGIVSRLMYGQGSFVPANTPVATIIDTSTVQVTANFRLARKDYGQLSKQTRLSVDLPNGSTVDTTLKSITVTRQTEVVETQVTAQLDKLSPGAIDLSTQTPVNTTVHLREETLWARLKKQLADWKR